ncbi:MAG: hypothetical protein GQE15_32290 [Archangiaceae bacterium]|nr:hypothetical protein [Archangiaceae bacterium]
MTPRPFLKTSRCVFASGAHLSREQSFLAAARLHVKPAALQTELPVCALTTDDEAEALRLVEDAKAVDVQAWQVTGARAAAVERATRVALFKDAAELTTPLRVRRIVFSQLAAYVDLRWKTTAESRALVLLPFDADPVLVTAAELEASGPSQQGALLKLTVGLQQAALAAVKERVIVQVLTPVQLGTWPTTPAEVVALALAEGIRLRSSLRS